MEYVILKQPRVLPNQAVYQVVKRVIDLGICLLVLPFALPVMLVCAIAIYLDSPGPIIFVQERMGKGGRLFKMYKFRSMKTNLNQGHFRDTMKAYVRAEVSKLAEEDNLQAVFTRGYHLYRANPTQAQYG